MSQVGGQADDRQKILVVERNRTRGRSLEFLLGELGGYQTAYVETMLDALKLIKVGAFDLIITNTGVDREKDGIKLAQMVLLRRMVKNPPRIMIVTTEMSAELVKESKRVGVVDYIVYPYDPDHLLRRVRSVFAERADMGEADVRKMIATTLRQIMELPTISPMYNRVEQLLHDKDATAVDLGEVLRLDPSISAKILKVANSAASGLSRTVTSVPEAIALIGFRKTGALIQAATTFEAIGRVEESPNFDRGKFWQHSIGTATVASVIADKQGMDPDRAFVAGILHDVGKVIMDGYFPDYFNQALEVAAKDSLSIYEAEKKVLPINHETVGRQLGTLWHLPEELVEVIGAHNGLHVTEEKHLRLVLLIHLANVVCRQMRVGQAGDEKRIRPHPSALTKLDLTPELLVKMKPALDSEVKRNQSLLQLV